MKEKLVFNICLDPEKSLLENLESEVRDCEVMIDLFTSRLQASDASFYEEKKAYLEKLTNKIEELECEVIYAQGE